MPKSGCTQDAIQLALNALQRAKDTDSLSETVDHIDTALLEIGAALACIGITESYVREYRTRQEMVTLRCTAEFGR